MFKSIYIPRFVMSTSARSSLTWLLKSFLARSQSNAVIGKTKLAFSLVFETSVEVNNICQEYARKTLLRTQQTYDLLSLENSEIFRSVLNLHKSHRYPRHQPTSIFYTITFNCSMTLI